MKQKKPIKTDLLLMAVLIVIGLVIAASVMIARQKGTYVTVSVGGEIVESFSLLENGTYKITGSNSGYNILVIENGQAWIREADCPDSLCVHMGRIQYAGQSIVCLPHQMVVQIEDGSAIPYNDVDAVSE